MNQYKQEKHFVFRYLSRFVSASIYLLMFVIALFIFYQVIAIAVSLGYNMFSWNFMEKWKLFLTDTTFWNISVIEILLSHITFILILVKAYRILESYGKHHHIEIKDLVEIAIIALIMEVIFNFWVHSIEINILFSLFWIALLLCYAWIPYFRKKKIEN